MITTEKFTPKLRRIVTATALGATLLASPLAAQDAEFTIRFAMPTANDCNERAGELMGEAIFEATNGRVATEIYPRHQLGGPSAMISGLQLGTIQAYLGVPGYFAGLEERMNLLSVPFIIDGGMDGANAVFQDPEVNDYILSMLEDNGIIGVQAVAVNPVLYLATSDISTLDGFEGLKFKSDGAEVQEIFLSRMGATAVPMGTGDIVPALQAGTIDGVGSGIAVLNAFNLSSISTQAVNLEDTVVPIFIVLSEAWLNTLPDGLAETVVEAARSTQADYAQLCTDDLPNMIAQWESNGGEIISFSDEDQARYREMMAGLAEEVSAGNPEMEEFRRLLQGE